MQKLQLQQIKKQIAQIGAVQPTSAYEKEMQDIKLETAKAELENLKNPEGKPPTATEQKNQEEAKLYQVIDGLYTDQDKVNWIKKNKSNIIGTFGSDYYNNLAGQYE